MSLQIGIVGLPNVGKSTLFNALTDANVLAANYPFATIEPNTGIVPIPDPRLNKLAYIYTPGATHSSRVQGAGEQRTKPYMEYGEGAAQSVTQQSAESTNGMVGSAGQQVGVMRSSGPKIVPATVEFVDIAGLVEGASQGEGLGNQFLAHIRSTSAICHIVRAFSDSDIQNSGTADPKKDVEIINTELILADIQSLEKRMQRLEKEAKSSPEAKKSLEVAKEVLDILNQGKLIGYQSILLKDVPLLTAKAIIYVFNVDEETLSNKQKQEDLKALVAPRRAIFVCAKLESELRGLDENDRKELLESYGQKESGLTQLIHAAYASLELQSYLTAGEKEVRAWTIPKGATAPRAAGVIHGDFERGFIAAQVINYDDLITAGSESAAKAAGKVRTEGKTYIMQPNDVVEFRFNV